MLCVYIYIYICIIYIYIYICFSVTVCFVHIYIYIHKHTVGFHNFNLRIFNLRVSNPNKLILDVFFDMMSDFNVPGSRPKQKHDEISEIDRVYIYIYIYIYMYISSVVTAIIWLLLRYYIII